MPNVRLLIAVVDDEELVRKAMGRLIGAADYSVQTFSSGADFLRSIEHQPPDCLVLDLHMPGMDGLDVLNAMRQLKQQIPVVVMTGDDSAAWRARALQCGAAAHLRKPVDEAMLLDAIRVAMRPRPARASN